eukprot:4641540-Amphidinium_carterae.1
MPLATEALGPNASVRGLPVLNVRLVMERRKERWLNMRKLDYLVLFDASSVALLTNDRLVGR